MILKSIFVYLYVLDLWSTFLLRLWQPLKGKQIMEMAGPLRIIMHGKVSMKTGTGKPDFQFLIDSLNLNNFVFLPAPGVQSISKAFQSSFTDSSAFTSTPSIIPCGLALVCGGKERATASNVVDCLLHAVHPLFSSPSLSYPVFRLLQDSRSSHGGYRCGRCVLQGVRYLFWDGDVERSRSFGLERAADKQRAQRL